MNENILCDKIGALRKASGMTQEQLATRLGVTYQAVSKWENAQSCPDIMLLPALAETFQVSIDALFGRETAAPPVPDAPPEREPHYIYGALPWPNDNSLYTALFHGHELMDQRPLPPEVSQLCQKVELHYSGDVVENVNSGFAVFCGSVGGDVDAGTEVSCGDVSGDVEAGGNVTCGGNVSGDVNAGGSVECADVGGDVACGGNVNADTAVSGGNVTCGNVSGDVDAGGGVECGDVDGDVNAGGSVNCGDVGGDVNAGGNVACGNVSGDASAGGGVECGGVGGDVNAVQVEITLDKKGEDGGENESRAKPGRGYTVCGNIGVGSSNAVHVGDLHEEILKNAKEFTAEAERFNKKASRVSKEIGDMITQYFNDKFSK